MDVTNLTHSRTSPADLVVSTPTQQEQTENALRPISAGLPGPLNVDHQRYLHPARSSRTCLLLVDIQRGLNTTHGFYGTERSTPQFEENVTSLLKAFRDYNAQAVHDPSTGSATEESEPNQPVRMIHVFHRSSNPDSPLHTSGKAQKDGQWFMPCAEPNERSEVEYVFAKKAISAFKDGRVTETLDGVRAAQLVVVGIATDHCVTTSVRWAKDLEVVKDDYEDVEGRIVIVSDATACFGKGGVDAEMVQKVHLASLDGEFAKVMSTKEVLEELFGREDQEQGGRVGKQ